jgi:NADPH-dependent 2,4-dienoyl-CoA reductase/sulfur reductase-like enzyme
MAATAIKTTCCIAGGGPAGMMLGFLLARAGVPVTVLEKHAAAVAAVAGQAVQLVSNAAPPAGAADRPGGPARACAHAGAHGLRCQAPRNFH